jgi:WD40 repeat protein
VPVERLAFTPDGRSLVVAAGRSMTVWALTSDGLEPRGDPIRGQAASVTALASAGSGDTVVTAGVDGILTLWDLSAVHPPRSAARPCLPSPPESASPTMAC